jgi:hypothetical protein
MMLWFVSVRLVVPVVADVGGTNVAGAISAPTVDGLEPRVPMKEEVTLGVGTAMSGLTPALPISTDPKGIPGRETPFGDVKGADVLLEAVSQAAAFVPAVPPPSKVLTPDIPPDIPVDALPEVEQVVPETSPPEGSVSIGLMPGELSSVAPSGMAVGPTNVPSCEPGDTPSGEVAVIPGVDVIIPPT